MTHRFFRTAARPVLLGLIAGFAIAAAAEEAHIVATPGSAKWGDAPPNLPKGAQLAVLHGDPGKAEMFSVMLKMPAGYKIPAHWHSQDENLVIISGAFYAGMGDKLDMKKAQALKPGAYVYMPAKMHHYAYTEEATEIQIHGHWPFDINYINPADYPRKN